MIGRLRELAARPIADRDRGRLLALTSAAILAATALSLLAQPHRTPSAPASTQPASPAPVKAAPASRRRASQPPGAPIAVVRAARAFLTGYLAFLYGHRDASAIADATPALRQNLTSRVLVVPPAQHHLHGRAINLTAAAERGGWSVRALIADRGVADYPIVLELTQTGGRWLVSGVSG